MAAESTTTRTPSVISTGATGRVFGTGLLPKSASMAALMPRKKSCKAAIIASASAAWRATRNHAARELRPRTARATSIGTASSADRMKNTPTSPAPGSPAVT